ncbi:conserved hypothetical protein; ankyrin repeat; putative exported protein [Cupriavidus taiwanensis]|uniref:ankyrin repeat domain-containing protein n=1 Tax=Cupriavidus taiwanensis TaxID=164546 RepID=UPI000E191740|nr:ankyrin repeat domain-containing protein [Cupriavidus taiwanensis]SPA22493.1 conserved hypothetical protein; ankyrin repeat; putative exported protein [Cupriavidus taiwanensis]
MLVARLFISLSLFIAMLTSISAAASATPEQQLREAAARGDAAQVSALLAQGASIDARDAQGRTALLLATHHNRVQAARVLIDAGADVNAQDAIHDSPYLYAGARGHNEILRLTLAHGADLRSTNRYGGTALIPAAERGHVETVRMLIAAGVAVDHVNRLKWTALLEAIILGNGGAAHTEIVRLLVQAGANVNLADGDGATPLQHARQRGYMQIQQILTAAGAR